MAPLLASAAHDTGTAATGRDDAEQHLRRVLAASPGIVYTMQRRGAAVQVTWIADSVRRLGYAPDEAIEGSWWVAGIHPDDRDRVLERVANLAVGSRISQQYRFARKTGEYVRVRDDLVLAPDDSGAPGLLVGALTEVVDTRDDEVAAGQATPAADTARIRGLESLTLLAVDIAQEMSNALMRAHRAADGLSPHLYSNTLKAIEASLDQCSTLARELSAHSKRVQPAASPVAPRDICAAAASDLTRILPSNIRVLVRTHPDEALPAIQASAAIVQESLVHLGRNASEAMPEGGTLTLDAEVARFDSDALPPTPAARPGVYVVLTVADTGSGMAADIRDRALDPFVTTRREEHLGLGLPMVARATRRAGGFVWIRSEAEHGTVVSLAFPVSLRTEDGAPRRPAIRRH